MQNITNDLLQREMTRREFMSTVGFALASAVGLAGLLRLFGHKGFAGLTGHYSTRGNNSYGNSPYGI